MANRNRSDALPEGAALTGTHLKVCFHSPFPSPPVVSFPALMRTNDGGEVRTSQPLIVLSVSKGLMTPFPPSFLDTSVGKYSLIDALVASSALSDD